MRQVRVGGRYDESREQRLWAALLGLIALATVGIVVVICDAGSGFCHPTLLRLAAGFAAVAIALAGPWHELTAAPPCPVADISTPPALDQRVRDALNGTLLDIDRLLAMTPGAKSAEAEAYSRRVDPLVDEAVNEYMDWLRDRGLRAHATAR